MTESLYWPVSFPLTENKKRNFFRTGETNVMIEGEMVIEAEPGETNKADLEALQKSFAENPGMDRAGNIWYPIL